MAETIRVQAADGQLLGLLSHVVGERGGTRPTGLVIQRNGDERVLPLHAVRRSSEHVIEAEWHSHEFHELAPFLRTAYRVIDEEMEIQAQLDEDFQIGAEEPEEAGGGGAVERDGETYPAAGGSVPAG